MNGEAREPLAISRNLPWSGVSTVIIRSASPKLVRRSTIPLVTNVFMTQ